MSQQQDDASRFEGEGHHGWSPDIGDSSGEAEEAKRKAMAEPSADRGEGRDPAEEERGGVGSAETAPGSPHGAGESTTRRPEEQADAAGTEGRKGASDRPYGRTDDEDTGVGSEGKATSGPDLPSGDQGG